MKYYDKANNRIVCLNKEATSEFWDDHWDNVDLKNKILRGASNRLLLGVTRRFLSKGSRVLEGGAGIGQNVLALKRAGYEAVGIDYANKTVKEVNRVLPELDLRIGDVRNLPFEDGSFEGYWSLGVIEHFYDGYEQIAAEMARVLKRNGILFLTFPYISSLRARKVENGDYPSWVEENNMGKFYQFMLDPKNVEKSFQNHGFKLVHRQPYDGIKGVKDEVKFLNKPLQWIYGGRFLPVRLLRVAVNRILTPYSGHMMLLVLRKIS